MVLPPPKTRAQAHAPQTPRGDALNVAAAFQSTESVNKEFRVASATGGLFSINKIDLVDLFHDAVGFG